MSRCNNAISISIGQLHTLITEYSKRFSSVDDELGESIVSMMADLLDYEVKVPMDYLQMFSGLLK